VAESIEALERRIDELRAAVRRAALGGDRAHARGLRAELRRAEHDWELALDDIEARAPDEPTAERTAGPARGAELTQHRDTGSLLPVREQVHRALTLLTVAAAPKLVTAVHEAFFAGEIIGARMTSLRRDEERSFRAAPHSRPYYICGALTADYLATARGLMAVSTWPLVRRVVGPLSPRVDFLIAAIQVTGQVGRLPQPGPAALRLLWRFAANIPGAADGFDADPAAVAHAAEAELNVHRDADRAHREAAADRAGFQLDDGAQLFGTRLRVISRTATV